MEVTSDNFDELLPSILEGIESCSFISVDTELSGLHPTDEKENFFDTVSERYRHLHKSATKFLIVQYGMVLFFYDPLTDSFTHRAYNFYIFPKQFSNSAPNVRFLCEASSLEFLAGWGFDFNKLIYKGIPYLTLGVENKMKENYDKKQLYMAEENASPLPVPENLKQFIQDTLAQVNKLVKGDVKELFLEDLNPFQRKLVFNNIKPKYADLYFETVVKDKDKEELDNSSVSESDTETPSAGSGASRPRTPSKSSRPGYNRVLRVAKMTEKERKARDDEKKRKVMDSIDKGVGFSKVIRKISETGKVVVGHNMVLDVAHSVHQFVTELPGDLEGFKQITQTAFPNLVDTKLMCCTHPFRELFSSTVLGDVLKRVQEEPFGLPKLGKREGEGDQQPGLCYELGDNKCHEAGFDAFVTGVCFLGLCQYLGTLQEPKKPRVLPDSPLVMPFLNKLYLMRMLDNSYLNISGTDLTPSRDHVFHVSCPKEATTKSILDIFSPFGSVQVRWQDDNNLFVSLQDKDQAPLVLKNIEHSPAFKVIPFTQYQSCAASKLAKRPLESKPKKKGKGGGASGGGAPPKTSNSNPKGPRQHSSASTSSTTSSSSEGGAASPPLPEVHHQKKKRPKTEKPSGGGGGGGKGASQNNQQGKGGGRNGKSGGGAALHFDEPSTWD